MGFVTSVFNLIYNNVPIDKKIEILWNELHTRSNGQVLSWSEVKRKFSKQTKLWMSTTLIVTALISVSSSFIGFGSPPPTFCKPLMHDTSCTIQTTGGNTAGLSNGVSAFDTRRKDGSLKIAAVKEFDANNLSAASVSLQNAIKIDPTDAEARIDQENLSVMDLGLTYSVIVGADIVSDPIQWEATLQGALTSQDHYNQSQNLPNNLKIVILIANFGGNQALRVIKLIGQAAQHDQQIIGIMDWPNNDVAGNAMQTIKQMNLPIILPTTESENMTGSYPDAFLVAATSLQEGTAAANFAMKGSHSKNVVIVKGIGDSYSENLVKAFTAAFQAANNAPIIPYTVGDEKDMSSVLNTALSYNPDLIYFAGDTADTEAFMNNPRAFATHPHFKVLASDPVYDLREYPPEADGRLYYTASAFEDMYRYLKVSPPEEMFCDYTTLFALNPAGKNCDQSKTYWKDRASSNTILAMDAMALLVQAIKIAGYSSLSPIVITKALMTMLNTATSFTSFQGLGGCITLGQDRKPINKNVVVLYVDNHSDTQIVYQEGCLTAPRSISMYDKQLPK